MKPDRGGEGLATLIAGPLVDDTAGVEAGFLGHQQNAAATGTLRPAQALGRKSSRRKPGRRLARGLDDHDDLLRRTLTAPYGPT